MSSIRTRQSALAASSSINAVLSVLNGTTPQNSGVSINASFTTNPFEFVMGVLEPIVGYDKIVSYLSEIIVYGLPALELAAKTALIVSLKDLFSCSVNPIISYDMINNGVVLDLATVDLLGILRHCPIAKENEERKINGQFFYSDVENYTIPDEVVNSKDLNAVIWFTKNRANDRTVWYGSTSQDEEHEELTLTTKPRISDGIITMEYEEAASNLTDSQDNLYRTQVPHGNCLHIFLGNTKGITSSPEPSSEELNARMKNFQDLEKKVMGIVTQLTVAQDTTTDFIEQSEIQNQIDLGNTILNAIKDNVPISEALPNMLVNEQNGKRFVTIGERLVFIDEYTYTHSANDLSEESKTIEIEKLERMEGYLFRTPEQNYYYHKTLFEFNTDFIMSVKLFDSKVIASQIIDILTGCFSTTVNLSFEERLIRNEVEKILKKIIETNDTTISDCFFSFGNDEYNQLMEDTENERIGRYTGDDYAYGTKIDYDTIYEELNKISSSATQSEEITNIKGVLNEIARTIKPEIYTTSDEWAFDVEFFNNILRGVALSMVYQIISPKIYLLMAVNLNIMGRNPNFDLLGFIKSFKALIVSTIRGITDEIMTQLRAWLMSLIGDLMQRVSGKLLAEQAYYYIRLLTRTMSYLQGFGTGNLNWNMGDVDYADIYEQETNNEANNEC